MKKKSVFLIFLFLSFSNVYSQISPKFEGYLYELPAVTGIPEMYKMIPGAAIEDDYMWSNSTRLRLRPELEFGYSGRLTLHYEISMSASQYLFTLPNFDMTNRQAVDLNWKIADGEKYYINHFIDRLYYKHMFDFGEVIIGRQNIAYGVGRIWQPTDLFNPLNPANYTKFEKDGSDAIRFKYYLGTMSDVEFVYNLRDEFGKSNFAGRYRTNWKEYDMSLMVGWFDENPAVGADFAGNLKGAGVRGEILYKHNSDSSEGSYFSAILGADYQFNSKLYGLIEYHYNGRGKNCKLCYPGLFEKVNNGEMQNVGTNYLAAQATYQVHPLVNLSVLDMTNLIDGSGFVMASGAYSALKNLDITLAGMFTYGGNMTEYSYYPSAGYMMLQFYF